MLFISYSVISQSYNLYPGQYEGYYIDKNDNKVEGYIQLNGMSSRPWNSQTEVKFFDEEATKDGKVKNREKDKFKVKDIKGYYADGFYWEAYKFSDMSAVGPGMLPKWYFLQELIDGPISIHRFYESPVIMGSTTEEMHAEFKRCLENPQILIVKEDTNKGKLKNVRDIDILEYISQCEVVKKKYLNGGYGITPKDDGEKTGLKGFVSKVVDANTLGNYIEEIAKDYNENCK